MPITAHTFTSRPPGRNPEYVLSVTCFGWAGSVGIAPRYQRIDLSFNTLPGRQLRVWFHTLQTRRGRARADQDHTAYLACLRREGLDRLYGPLQPGPGADAAYFPPSFPSIIPGARI